LYQTSPPKEITVKIIGSVDITKENQDEFADVTEISGYVRSGYVWLYEGATFTADAPQTINGLPLPSKEEAERNLRLIAPLALAESALDMKNVHTCETMHCMAGWACYAIPGGAELEKKHGWMATGAHFLGMDAANLFYSTNKKAAEFLRQYVD
jgi:hypothetical protein